MIPSYAGWRSSAGTRVFVWGMLFLGLLGGGAPFSQAQNPADTTQKAQKGLAPAPLDSLPSGKLAAPPESTDSPDVASDTGDAERVFVNADSLSTIQRQGEKVQKLFGNVFVRQDTTRLRSDFARRYPERDELLFIGDVVIYERGDTLRADTVRYDRVNEIGYARGHVRLTDGDVRVRAPRATYYAAEKRSVFPDSVVLVDSNRVLRARHGTYWSDEQRAEFGGEVKLTKPGTTIFSDSLTYYRDQERSVAEGHVFITRVRKEEQPGTDTTARTYIFGKRVDTREKRQYTRMRGRALLVRIRMDSTGAPTDTLIVRSHRLEAFRTDALRRLVAVDSVRIWQPDLAAVADSVVYDRVVSTTPDSTSGPGVPSDTTRPPSDSLGTIAGTARITASQGSERRPVRDSVDESQNNNRARGGRTNRTSPATDDVPSAIPDSANRRGKTSKSGDRPQKWTTPTAHSKAQLPLEEIRLFRNPMTWFENNQVWGDSIRIRAQNRSPDTVFVRGSAFAAKRDSVLGRIHQLKAQHITAFFRADSLRRIRGAPNARVIRFLASQTDSLSGAARASGDWVVLRFLSGGGKHIKFGPGIEGSWYRKPENIPDPFRLEGFQWVPERRPTRGQLLRDRRVRRRLDLPLSVPSRPIVQRQEPSSSGSRSRARNSTGQDSLRQMQRPPKDTTAARSLPSQRADSLRSKSPPQSDSIPPPIRPITPSDTLDTEPDSQP